MPFITSRLTYCAAALFVLVGCSKPATTSATSAGTSTGGTTTAGTAAAPATPAAPAKATVNNEARENVKTAIAEAIRLLEAKEYKLFAETFAFPEFLKEVSASPGGLDAMVNDVEKHAPEMLKDLKDFQGKEPQMIGADTAKFEIKREVAGQKPETGEIIFKKIDKYWYIEN
jgi:hypothetical protein